MGVLEEPATTIFKVEEELCHEKKKTNPTVSTAVFYMQPRKSKISH
jgi:hypothetical protein